MRTPIASGPDLPRPCPKRQVKPEGISGVWVGLRANRPSGSPLRRHVDGPRLRVAVLALSTAGAVALLARTLLGPHL